MALNPPAPGGLSTAEFMVSSIPWVTSSVVTGIAGLSFRDTTLDGSAADMTYVARFVRVVNKGAAPLGIAFTRRGFDTGNNFQLSQNEIFEADLRISALWVSGSASSYNVVAGLTGIQNRHVPVITASNGFPGVG